MTWYGIKRDARDKILYQWGREETGKLKEYASGRRKRNLTNLS